MLSLGIVGLPNVGKSSLFNALTAAKAEAANYPFCTVDPNVGMVEVPDARLGEIARIVNPKKTVPAAVQFVDIAGLVKGAASGEGLGNKFLSNIRETDAIVHVIRCFDDPDVTHVMGGVDPVRDREIIEIELALADLGSVEKRLDKVKRTAKTGDKEALAELPILEKANTALAAGTALWHAGLSADELAVLKPLALLTMKPILYAANVTDAELAGSEGPYVTALRAAIAAAHEPAEVVTFSAKIESAFARGTGRVSGVARHRERRPRSPDPRRLPPARPADLLHGGREGSARVDDPSRRHRAGGGRRDPQRFREGLHPRRDVQLRRFRLAWRLEGGQGERRRPGRRQGLRGAGWRCDAVPHLGQVTRGPR
jgi:ribosome-binding ATPase YchF (GTP1/OBG family)